ncbi:integrase core domain-containing protein [uncultured Desulfovibrio sp.]|uniref:integrase core domain-containing protein n=1 Tax=uncultured Desulfovibrio sp. TaxID=167968 RepID=UPI00345DD04E
MVDRVLADNGACCKSWKFRHACRELGIQHKRTRQYSHHTTGHAERCIRTSLKEWAYACTYTHSWKRTQDLPIWTYRYNFQRPHGSWQEPASFPATGCGNKMLTSYTRGPFCKWRPRPHRS